MTEVHNFIIYIKNKLMEKELSAATVKCIQYMGHPPCRQLNVDHTQEMIHLIYMGR
jgi:hypothetical protein